MPNRRRFIQRSGLAAGALFLPELPMPSLDAWSPDGGRLSGKPFPAGPDLPLVQNVDPQGLIDQVRRLLEATESLSTPLSAEDQQVLRETFALEGTARSVAAAEAIQRVLDRSCLVGVQINPEMRVKVARGPARPGLLERGWRTFLVKVHNEAGTTAALRATGADLAHRWLDLRMVDEPPLSPTLSGLELEYHVVRLYSRDAGLREASLAFDVGQGTQDLGFRNEVPILFDCRPAS
jgi:hypothetical protein